MVMTSQYIVLAKRNMAVCDDLREVFSFLGYLKEHGISYARIMGSDQNVRLSENGYWIWTTAKEEVKTLPVGMETRKTCGV
jgi:hypothetical protein